MSTPAGSTLNLSFPSPLMPTKKKAARKVKKVVKRKAPKKTKRKVAKKSVKKGGKSKVKKAKAVKKGKKIVAKAPKMPPVLGKVTHYYDHIGVGVLSLKSPLNVGEKILLKRGKQEFTQIVKSLQIDHESVSKASKGAEVGLKLKEKIKEGALVYKA